MQHISDCVDKFHPMICRRMVFLWEDYEDYFNLRCPQRVELILMWYKKSWHHILKDLRYNQENKEWTTWQKTDNMIMNTKYRQQSLQKKLDKLRLAKNCVSPRTPCMAGCELIVLKVLILVLAHRPRKAPWRLTKSSGFTNRQKNWRRKTAV